MQIKRLKPRDGLIVRLPEPPYRRISVEGEELPLTTHIRRLMASGDLVAVDDVAASEETAGGDQPPPETGTPSPEEQE